MIFRGRNEMKVTVLFGTVEYFEREFLRYAAKSHSNNEILTAFLRLKDELLHDFICSEGLRKECLENLSTACKNFKNLEMRATS
jgi:hypothetical protein